MYIFSTCQFNGYRSDDGRQGALKYLNKSFQSQNHVGTYLIFYVRIMTTRGRY